MISKWNNLAFSLNFLYIRSNCFDIRTNLISFLNFHQFDQKFSKIDVFLSQKLYLWWVNGDRVSVLSADTVKGLVKALSLKSYHMILLGVGVCRLKVLILLQNLKINRTKRKIGKKNFKPDWSYSFVDNVVSKHRGSIVD